MRISKRKVQALAKDIRLFVTESKQQIAQTVNVGLLATYWHVGKMIVSLEETEKYDLTTTNIVLSELAIELQRNIGKGFSKANLFYMRLFFTRFQSYQTVSDNNIKINKGYQTLSDNNSKSKNKAVLTVSERYKKTINEVGNKSGDTKVQISEKVSWSHYIELLKCTYDEEVKFYMQLCISENLGVRELRTHQKKALFERVVLSKNKIKAPTKVIKVVKKNSNYNLDDFYRDPLILEFLNIPSNYKLTEKKLEQKILDNIQMFMLELGKGFSFVGRQYRLSVDGRNFHIDLVFYHYILKCFVLIDLKIDDVQHEDIGQMNFYLNYFKTEVGTKSDNPPIGIILSKHNNEMTAEFALGGITNNIFLTKYQLYLPDKKLLERKVKLFFNNAQPPLKINNRK
jgi:predicted nuclease of restriction endonuclease-like (RecB) superfamily